MFDGFKYLWKKVGPKVSIFGPTLTRLFLLKMAKIEKISSSSEELQSLSYPNMLKESVHLLSPFPEKWDYFLKYLGYFSKFDKYYFIHTIPGQLPVKKFWFKYFQFCGYRSQRTFQKNQDFQILLVFLVPFLHF